MRLYWINSSSVYFALAIGLMLINYSTHSSHTTTMRSFIQHTDSPFYYVPHNTVKSLSKLNPSLTSEM